MPAVPRLTRSVLFATPRALARLLVLTLTIPLAACDREAALPSEAANVSAVGPTRSGGLSDSLAADPALAGATPAPDFTLPGPSGDFSLAAHRGHVVVLTFWATWSDLGRAQLGTLDSLHAELSAQGVVLVGVAQDENGQRALQAYAAEHTSAFPLLADSTQTVAAQYGRIEMLPTTIVVDREGLIRARRTGVLRRAALLDLLGPVLIEGDEPMAWLPASIASRPGEVATLPASEASALVATGAMLVDVRDDRRRAAEGAIRHAAALPLDALQPSDLPANVGVPLVFLGDTAEATRAAEQAVAWGYATVVLVEDGLAGWKAAGLPVEAPTPAGDRPARPSGQAGTVIG